MSPGASREEHRWPLRSSQTPSSSWHFWKYAVSPPERLVGERHGDVRRPPKRIAGTGMPAGSSHSGSTGPRATGVVKRELGWDAGPPEAA